MLKKENYTMKIRNNIKSKRASLLGTKLETAAAYKINIIWLKIILWQNVLILLYTNIDCDYFLQFTVSKL